MASDPFTLVHDALWSMVDNDLINNIVKPRNKINFNADSGKNRDPLKDHVAASDVPEVMLISDGMLSNMHETSSSTSCVRRYSWLLATGDLRIAKYLYPIEWAIFASMLNWKATIATLEFAGKRFVKRADIIEVTEGVSDPERNRGLIGWSSVWRCEFEMHFKTQDLIDLVTP